MMNDVGGVVMNDVGGVVMNDMDICVNSMNVAM